MKKFLQLLLFFFVALFCVSCGAEEKENTADKAKEYLNSLEIVYAEGESASVCKSNITLKNPTAEGVTVVWTSDNEAILIDGLTGVVTQSLEDVKVKIIAKLTYKDITLTKPFNVVVANNKPASIAVTGVSITAEKTEIEVDEELALTVTVAPENATNKAVSWTTGDASVATVDRAGKVTGISAGEVTITATSDDNPDFYASVNLVVIEPLPISTIANVLAQLEVVDTKIMATVVGKYAQGYMLYDETGYILYYLGKDAKLDYQIGDYLEVVGKVEEYNGRYQFTKAATATKLANNTPYTFDYFTYTAEELPSYLENVEFGQPVEFQAICSKASGSYAEFTIKGTTYGLTIAYPMDLNAYTAGVEYLVHGFALYAKEYQSVNSLYVMEIDCAPIYTVKFSTGVESIVVDDIVYTDCNTIELPSIYREGFFFMGWKDGENTVEYLTENKDYTLTADWIERNFEAVDFELNGGEFVFDNQFYIGNYNSCEGVVKKYDCYTIYKKGSASVAWASQYYLKFFMKEIEAGTNIYKIVYKAGQSVAVEGDLLAGVTYDYDYIISSNASNTEGHPYFQTLFEDEYVENYYWYFEIPTDCKSVCNIKVIFNLEKSKIDTKALKYEADETLPDVEKPYYDFLGWFDNAELTGEPITTHVSGVKKYYAKFDATTYAISFELNGGETSTSLPETYTNDSESIALPTADQMTKEGFKFVGWFDNANCSGKNYTAIEKGSFGDLTLYAGWEDTRVFDKELSAADVAVLNTISATKFVFTDAVMCKYNLIGEGLSAAYTTNPIPSTSIFNTLANAIYGAVEGDVIYVCAGTYADEVTLNAKNVTVIGPNYNTHGHAETRADEANVQGVFHIYGEGAIINGLQFTDASYINVMGKQVTLANNYINGTPEVLKANNRKGMVIAYTTEAVENLTMKDNYFLVPGDLSGYQHEPFCFTKVKDLVVEGNYIENKASANCTANTEEIIIYSPQGTVKFINNEFHMFCDTTSLRFGFTSFEATIQIIGNKFYGLDNGNMSGKLLFENMSATSTVEIIGNEFHSNAENMIKIDKCAGTINVRFNKFYAVEYNVLNGNASTTAFTYESNYFEKGVAATDTTAATTSSKTLDEVNQAYDDYKKIN